MLTYQFLLQNRKSELTVLYRYAVESTEIPVHHNSRVCLEISYPGNDQTKVRMVDYGASIVISKLDGKENLWFSETNKFDGNAAVYGGWSINSS